MTPSLRFPLRAEGTELAHGMVPLAKRGEPSLCFARFPSRSGGNLKEGGEQNSARAIGKTE